MEAQCVFGNRFVNNFGVLYMLPYTFCFLLCCGVLFVKAQSENKEESIWCFGDNVGLDFNTDPPTLIASAAIGESAFASYSDADGSLLFYTNGEQVWNSAHAPMQDGFGLDGNTLSTGITILPWPDSDSLYYIFTSPGIFNTNDGVRFHVVDMSENGGLGRVISKNDTLVNPACQKIAAVKRCNGNYWLVAHEYPNSNRFFAYQVTPFGIEPPVISIAGYIVPQTGPSTSPFSHFATAGSMKFSRDGSMLAVVHGSYGLELLQFDIETGEVYNPILLDLGVFSGVAFSPNNSYLYAGSSSTTGGLVQYDLSAQDIAASKVDIAQSGGATTLELAIDGKIYVTRIATGPDYDLLVINSPNERGHPTNVTQSASNVGFTFPTLNFSVGGPVTYSAGLSNFPVKPRYHEGLFRDSLDIASCSGDSVMLYQGNTVADHLWSNGDTTATIYVQDTGLYTVEVSYDGCTYVDSFYVENSLMYVGSLREYYWCAGDTVSLETDIQGIDYTWSTGLTGSTEDSTAVLDTGFYFVGIDLDVAGLCRDIDTFVVRGIFEDPQFLEEVLFCEGAVSAELTANVNGGAYLWSTGDTGQTVEVPDTGLYFVDITLNSCSRSDSFNVVLKELFPRVIDTLVCDVQEVTLDGGMSDAGYLWSDGTITSSNTVSSSGLYTVIKGDEGCAFIDSFTVTIISTTSSKTLVQDCYNTSTTLTSRVSEDGYKWSNGSTDSVITVSESKDYTVLIVSSGCETLDSFEVYVDEPLRSISMGEDSVVVLCEGEPKVLTLDQPNTSYEWDDGATSSTRTVVGAGLYWVKGTNECGTSRDSIRIEEEECPCALYFPEAFSPNGDGDNDLFKGETECEFKLYEMRIFDRWGRELYSTDSYDKEGWDGTYEGKPVAMGMYVYELKYQYEFGLRTQKNSGAVFLLP